MRANETFTVGWVRANETFTGGWVLSHRWEHAGGTPLVVVQGRALRQPNPTHPHQHILSYHVAVCRHVRPSVLQHNPSTHPRCTMLLCQA